MPAAIKKSLEYGDDLVVLLVESQGTPEPQAEAFQYDKGWMAGNAYWTHERPCSSGLGFLPSYVLLDVNGKVLMKGNPMSDKSKIEDAIEEQIKLSRELPDSAPKSAKKAWKLFKDRSFAKSLEAFAKLEEKADEAEAAPIAELKARVVGKIEAELARIDALVDLGHLLPARALAEELADDLEDHETFGQRAADAVAMFAAADMQAELEAAEDFEKLHEKIREDGLEDFTKKLEKFAEKYAGTKAAERASYLLSLAAA